MSKDTFPYDSSNPGDPNYDPEYTRINEQFEYGTAGHVGAVVDYRVRKLLGENAADADAWILASEAVGLLPLISDLPALYKFAEQNPDKLKLRPHPEHGRRRQANAADVAKLAVEQAKQQLDLLGRPDADGLPTISEKGLNSLAERVQQMRTNRQK